MAVTESVFGLIQADGQVDTSAENSCLILLLSDIFQAAAVEQMCFQNIPLYLQQGYGQFLLNLHKNTKKKMKASCFWSGETTSHIAALSDMKTRMSKCIDFCHFPFKKI